MSTYLDCNATTPLDPAVREIVLKYLEEDFGNAGSRTHEFGLRAKKAVETAREQVAAVLGASPDEVIFTSGATESNNLALLGLAGEGQRVGRRHILSSGIEHKAVLEPLEHLGSQGFEVELLPVLPGGFVDPAALEGALREDTFLVSMMQVNNETGVIQPLEEYCRVLEDHEAFFHVDAAQGFGKVPGLDAPRIDLASISGHKVYAPKGVGALLARKRRWRRPPLAPLFLGGGQERGLRPGTLPVHLIAGLGEAAGQAQRSGAVREAACRAIKNALLDVLAPLDPVVHGDQARTIDSTLNLSVPGVDGEAAIVALRSVAAVANGAACTSHSYSESHVLRAMGVDPLLAAGAVRFSWCHMTECRDWQSIADALQRLRCAS